MKPIWQLSDLENKNSVKFTEIKCLPSNIYWHLSDLTDVGKREIEKNGGTQELIDFLDGFEEVKGLHLLIKENPEYFFDTKSVCWGYTGKVGEAPDFVGVSKNGDVHIAEVKWKMGWSEKLKDQIPNYGNNFFCNPDPNRELTIHIAALQGVHKSQITNLKNYVENLKNSNKWKNVHMYFGFIQPGWIIGQNDYYLHVIWLKDSDWIGNKFNNNNEKIALWGCC